MGTLKKDMQKYYQTENLYELLNIPKEANADDIKKAYRKLSLKVHPDRVTEKDKKLSTIKFQIAGKVYSVLSDAEKRKIYDETGIADDDLPEKVSDWVKYFSQVFHKVEVEDIEQFKAEYVGSAEEANDLKRLYERFKGDMNLIMEHHMFYEFELEDQYREIINAAIKKKEVPEYKLFFNEKPASIEARRKKLEREAKAAAKVLQKPGGGGDGDLVKQIQQNQQQRAGQLSDFLTRYAQPSAGGDHGSDSDNDDEEGDLISGDETNKNSDEDGEEEDEKPKPAVKRGRKTKSTAKKPAAKRRGKKV